MSGEAKVELVPDPDGPVRYPGLEVELIGHDGNAFFILGTVQKEMRRAGVRQGEIDAYMALATGGNYEHLLTITQQWVEVI